MADDKTTEPTCGRTGTPVENEIFVSSVMAGFEECRGGLRSSRASTTTSRARTSCLDYSIARGVPSQRAGSRPVVLILDGDMAGQEPSRVSPRHTRSSGKRQQRKSRSVRAVRRGRGRHSNSSSKKSKIRYGMHRSQTAPEKLRTEVTRAIAGYQLSAAASRCRRAGGEGTSTIPVEGSFVRMTSRYCISVVGGPTQTILRPSEDQSLVDGVVADLSSADGYFSTVGNRAASRHGALVIEQENGAARIDEAGALLLSVPIEEATGYLKPLIEEHVGQAIEKGLTFADKMLEKFDRTQRLTRIVIAADIATSGGFGWRTSSQQAASPNSMQIAMDRSASGPVMLNPPDRTRMALRSERTRMAEDLLALLRRRYRS